MVTTNQRSVIDTHTNKRKEAKHNNKDSHQTTGKKAKEEERNNNNKEPCKNNPRTINKLYLLTN